MPSIHPPPSVFHVPVQSHAFCIGGGGEMNQNYMWYGLLSCPIGTQPWLVGGLHTREQVAMPTLQLGMNVVPHQKQASLFYFFSLFPFKLGLLLKLNGSQSPVRVCCCLCFDRRWMSHFFCLCCVVVGTSGKTGMTENVLVKKK